MTVKDDNETGRYDEGMDVYRVKKQIKTLLTHHI